MSHHQSYLIKIQYKKSISIELESSFQKSIKPKWSYNAVLRILKNEVYTGTVVQGKCTTPNYKIKKRIHKDETEWIRGENMHEAIVSRSEFDLVQALLLRDTRVSPDRSEVFPLAGMVYCADCGEPMVRKTIPSNGKKYIYYVCAGNKRDKTSCSSHSISERRLTGSVLELVKTFVGKVMALSEAVEVVSQAHNMKPEIVKYENRILKLREEAESCNLRRKNLYEDFKDGILTKDEYSMLRDQYQSQIAEIESSIATLESERDGLLANGSGKQEWIENFKKYKGIVSLDRSLITFLIERIDVIDGNTLQVTYRFQKEIAELEHVVELYATELKEAI
ncbi:MAG: recombinase family protein [Lachnobacterium sp.]|nr:recombinase family protein [Lachnobacterium sp.]MDY5461651.1 recombinase family protein [Agathobacter sp.]